MFPCQKNKLYRRIVEPDNNVGVRTDTAGAIPERIETQRRVERSKSLLIALTSWELRPWICNKKALIGLLKQHPNLFARKHAIIDSQTSEGTLVIE